MNGQKTRSHACAPQSNFRRQKSAVLSVDRCAARPDEAMRAGAAAYLTKPVTPEILKDTCSAFFPRIRRTQCDECTRPLRATRARGGFSRQCFLRAGPPGPRPRGNVRRRESILEFSGAANGKFFVVVSEDLARRMTADFLALDAASFARPDPGMVNVEFANVACGAILSAWMPAGDFIFSIPRGLHPDGRPTKFQALLLRFGRRD